MFALILVVPVQNFWLDKCLKGLLLRKGGVQSKCVLMITGKRKFTYDACITNHAVVGMSRTEGFDDKGNVKEGVITGTLCNTLGGRGRGRQRVEGERRGNRGRERRKERERARREREREIIKDTCRFFHLTPSLSFLPKHVFPSILYK